MPKLTIAIGGEFPAFPGYVAGVDRATADRTKIVALRVAPKAGPVAKAFEAANLRTVRIPVAPGTELAVGDDVIVPASKIRQSSTIQLTDKTTGETHEMLRLGPDGKPILVDGKTVPLMVITVKPSGNLRVDESRLKAEQIVRGELSPAEVAAAEAAFA